MTVAARPRKPDPDLPDPKRRDRFRAKAGLLVRQAIREHRRDIERAAAAQAKAAISGTLGGGEVSGVVREDGPDPDAPNRTVRRDRRCSGYDWLHARGVITDQQREAADRYCVAHERLSGASERRPSIIARVPPWRKGHPSEMQVAASADIRQVHAIIGRKLNREVLDGVVLEGKTLDELATKLSEPVSGIAGRLRAVLDIMAEQWGMD